MQCSSQRAGGADRLEGENVIFDPITDDAKSVPPVMQKPNISHTHTHTTTERQTETLRMNPFPMVVRGI